MTSTPYQGLLPYLEGDSERFFGRDAECEIISANLMAARLTLLYGASGVGKSSVLHAGVARRLRDQSFQNLTSNGSPEFVVVAFRSWRDDPVAGLARRVGESVALLDPALAADPPIGPAGLAETIQAWSRRIDGDILVLLDQFEEYFLYHPNDDGRGSFPYEFARALNRSDLRVSFLLSLREDAVARLDQFKGRINGLFDNYLRIRHLDREAARAAILKPLEYYNDRFTGDGDRITVEPGLVDAVLEQVRAGRVVVGEGGHGAARRAGTGEDDFRIETPYLQLVMTRLWETERAAGSRVLRRATLERLGGAQQIVRTHLDATMDALPKNQQAAAARIFRYLVTRSGTKIAHEIGDLADLAGLSVAEIQPLLDHLSDPGIRVLRPVAPPPERPQANRFEIFHDVLAPAILDWRARYVQEQERIKAARKAAEAEERRRIEERARLAGILRWAVIALALSLLVAVGLGLLARHNEHQAKLSMRQAYDAMREAHRQAGLAESRRQEAARQRDEAQRRRDQAEHLRIEADHARREAVQQRQIAFTRELAAEANDNLHADADRSLWLAFSSVLLHRPVVPQAEQALHRALLASRASFALAGHSGSVLSLAFSPDGSRLVTVGDDGMALLWDTYQGSALPVRLNHGRGLLRAFFTRDNGQVLTAGDNGTVRIWDARSGEQRRAVHLPDGLTDFAWFPDGPRLAAAGADGRVWTSTLASGQPPSELRAHSESVRAVAFSRDGRRLATGSADRTAKVWDLASSEPVAVMTGHAGTILALAFSPDGRLLATGGEDRIANVWHTSNGQLVRTLAGHTDDVTGVAFSPDGSALATASLDQTAKVWEVGAYQEILSLPGHAGPLQAVAFHPDGSRLATASDDKTVRVWSIASDQDLLTLAGHRAQVRGVAFSPDGARLATAGLDAAVKIWDVASGWDAVTLLAGSPVNAVAFSPDGKHVAGVGAKTFVWDLASRKVVATGPGSASAYQAAFRPDGRRIAVGSVQGAYIWDPDQTNADSVRLPHPGSVRGVAFSPDGRLLATAAVDGATRLWDLASRRTLWVSTPPSKGYSAYAVAFRPDGQWVATAGSEGDAVIRDARTGRVVCTLAGHAGWVFGVAFSPDGRRVATAAMDKTVKLWDAESGKELITLSGHTDRVNGLAFSPDGRLLATAGADGYARLFGASVPELLAIARSRLNRGPSPAECSRYFTDAECRRIVPAFASLAAGRQFARAASLDAAADAFRKARRLEPALEFDPAAEARHQAAEGLLANGRSHARAGEVDRAAALFQRARELNPRLAIDPRGMALRLATARLDAEARSLALAGDIDGAVERFEQVRALDPGLPLDPRQEAGKLAAGALAGRARTAADNGDLEGALSLFRQAHALHANSAPDPEKQARTLTAAALLRRGRALADAGDFPGAVAALQRALALNPALKLDPPAEAARRVTAYYVDRGLELARRGSAREALDRFAAAERLHPSIRIRAANWNSLCWAASLAGSGAAALPACDRAVTLEPDNAAYRDSRGVALALAGRFPEAVADLQAGLAAERDETWQAQRRRWIGALRAGRNPITPDELQKLRNSEDD